MTWLEQWRALAARIEGLIRAGEFLVSAFAVNSSDDFEVVRKSFLPELTAISTEIEQLGKVYADALPPKAFEALQKYIALQNNITQIRSQRNITGRVDIQALASLAAFRSQFEYLLRDTEAEGRNLTAFAFEHLRRQLVVDTDVRTKWRYAFKRHETACERLGAVHLLSHGIWAFKVVAPGGATDLVFGDPVEQHSEIVSRTARALVLTEWKLVKRRDNITTKAQEGRNQAAIYSGGVLGDAELKRTRYVVLVCELDLTPPDDVVVGTVTYRHVVLPVNPEDPSKISRSRKSRAKS
ncbi:MAG: hypothetical protein MPW15_09675 [Candidatus Manganitrophus sp.]|nr:hypothetical protein [Candidatus Manganitrophus sp.]